MSQCITSLPLAKTNIKIHSLLWRPSVESWKENTGRHRASKRQKDRGFPSHRVAAAEGRDWLLDTHPKTNREDKSPEPVGVFAWVWRISELPSEGALLDLDNCLQRSLDTSRQMALPIKHSVAGSFTPQQLLSDGEKRSKYVSDDSLTPPHRKHLLNKKSFSPSMFNHCISSPHHSDSSPQGDTAWLKRRELRKSLRSSESVNEDTVIILSDWHSDVRWAWRVRTVSKGQHGSPDLWYLFSLSRFK